MNEGLSRRDLLKLGAAAAGAYLASRFLKEKPEPDLEQVDFEGHVFLVDKEGIPHSCRTKDGTEITFNRNDLRRAQTEAKNLKADRVGETFAARQEREVPAVGGAERPLTKQLPDDIVSSEKLQQQYGIKIVQSDITQLHIRQSAFAQGGLLEEFARGGRDLTIALIQAPFLIRRYFANEKYRDLPTTNIEGGVVGDFGKDLPSDQFPTPAQYEELRQQKILALKKIILQTQDKSQLLELLADIHAYASGVVTDEDLLYESTNGRMLAAGFYDQQWSEEGSKDFIFLAVDDRLPRDLMAVCFDKDGKFFPKKYTMLALQNARVRPPQPWQSHPDGAHAYTYAAASDQEGTIGFNLRHELGHDRLRLDNLRDSEQGINDQTKQRLQADWRQWQESGFGRTDQKGDEVYPFVFSIPPALGGGYILT